MMSAKVQILMAVRNGERFIEEQLDSILCQDYTDFHLLIRDNCSDDRTCAIVQDYIKRYPDKITLLKSEENVGALGNFSALLDRATSDYVMFADHDDVWLPEKISKSVKKMKELESKYGKTKPALIHSDSVVVDQNLKTIARSLHNFLNLKPAIGEGMLGRQLFGNTVVGHTVLMNRSLVELARPISQDALIHDAWVGFVAAAFGMIGYLPEPMVLYRQHENNEIGVKQDEKLTVEGFCNRKNRTLKQTYAFLRCYESRLEPKHKKVLQGYIRYLEASLPIKILLVLRFGFYKYQRNIGKRLFRCLKMALQSR